MDQKVLVAAILGSFKDHARELTLGYKPENFTDVNNLFDTLESSFCGGAVSERAFVSFSTAYQSNSEDTTNFGIELKFLSIMRFLKKKIKVFKFWQNNF